MAWVNNSKKRGYTTCHHMYDKILYITNYQESANQTTMSCHFTLVIIIIIKNT